MNPEFQGDALAANLALADALEPVAEKHCVEVGAVAIAWCLTWPGLTGVIVGVRSPMQVDVWITAASLEPDAGDVARVATAIKETGAGEGPTLPV